MLTGKQRSYLKSIAHSIKPITQIGKNGISESLVEELNLALEARELIKISLLETSLLTAQEAAEETSKLLNAEFVQAIGNKFTIYRKSSKNPKIELPKS
ncbi:ribosome assembly RNA-binding protein YhbY [Serpentinicella alkaliphila]|uniref:RNA-binding protein n=1 Tax=Serpentinicella alkaliphila TaxID=1734049 RepID=A0A4R2TVQ0_9FIRM|nr:ribosome assembly RNA-binding protein YhbY [Serpentinicella alkaliphila]QUH26761.1 ribosome assembly RNA-binding protein YhbY [Serpentinicella alkaliphila]TCQ07981.1 RNA-binding protein [Serpentinicella alkaliphila]